MIRRLLQRTLPCTLAGFLFSCHSVSEIKPDDYLNHARELVQKQEYQLAKLYVDSVTICFPKEYAKIREGIRVLREINYAEQMRTLAFCDSMLKVRQNQLPEAQRDFTFEKDEEYETIGHYVPRSQSQGNTIGRTFVQTKVDENGSLVLTSYYCGRKGLRHDRLRASAPDGTYAETATISHDGALNYSFQDAGLTYEIVRFNRKTENGVIDFILSHPNTPILITLTGTRSMGYRLSNTDTKAMASAANLSAILTDIRRLLNEIRLAQAKLEYIRQKEKGIDSRYPTTN
jgi:hypothetical protein